MDKAELSVTNFDEETGAILDKLDKGGGNVFRRIVRIGGVSALQSVFQVLWSAL